MAPWPRPMVNCWATGDIWRSGWARSPASREPRSRWWPCPLWSCPAAARARSGWSSRPKHWRGVLLLLFGGVIADRYSRSAVMAVSDVISVGGVVGFILLAEAGPLPALMFAACLVGIGGALYQPAHRAAMPQVVPVDLLQKANALDSATKRLGAAGGALLGALLIVSVGAKGAFAVDIVTFVVSLVTLLWLRLPAVGGTPSGMGVRAVLAEAREGIGRGTPPALGARDHDSGNRPGLLPLRAELRAGADREPAAVGPGGVRVAQLVGVDRHDARLGAGRADHDHGNLGCGR